jgi:hypothetical protein
VCSETSTENILKRLADASFNCVIFSFPSLSQLLINRCAYSINKKIDGGVAWMERLTSTFAKLRQGNTMTAQQMHVAQKGSHSFVFFSGCCFPLR